MSQSVPASSGLHRSSSPGLIALVALGPAGPVCSCFLLYIIQDQTHISSFSLHRLSSYDLSINDEPHIIFETLNARGTPLLQSDLIKNVVLYKAGIEESESNSNKTLRLWNFPGDWWRTEIGKGGNRNPRIDVFLNYWLIMKTRSEVRADRTSTVFRNHVEKVNSPIESIAADIRQVSQTYRFLEEGKITGFETFLYRREVMQVGTLTPVLLWLFSSEMPDEQRKRAVLALESYLVRRMVCRMTTRSYYQLFLGMLSSLEDAGTAHAGDAAVKYLSEQTAYANQWPDDRDLENAFLTVPLYHSLTRARLSLVLEGLEEHIRSDMVESFVVPRGLTIEHIMPQKWDGRWPLPSRERSVEKAMELRGQSQPYYSYNWKPHTCQWEVESKAFQFILGQEAKGTEQTRRSLSQQRTG